MDVFKQFPGTFWTTTLLVVTGSFFQFGYFWHFGPEFLSTVGATDWLFYIGVFSFPALGAFAVGGAAYDALEAVEKFAAGHIRFGQLIWKNGAELATTVLVVILTVWLSVDKKTAGPAVLLGLALIIGWKLRSTVRKALVGQSTKPTALMALATLWALFGFGCGMLYEQSFAGRECTVRLKGLGERSYVYMRMVTDGHLMKSGEEHYYFPKTEVELIRCKMPKDRNRF